MREGCEPCGGGGGWGREEGGGGGLVCAVGLKNGGFLTVAFSRKRSGRLELLADDWRRLFVRQSLPGRLAAEKRNSKESHHFFVTPLQNQGPETEAAAETALPQPHVPTRPTHHPLTPAQEVTRETDTHLKDPLHYAVRKVKKIKDKKIRTKKQMIKN